MQIGAQKPVLRSVKLRLLGAKIFEAKFCRMKLGGEARQISSDLPLNGEKRTIAIIASDAKPLCLLASSPRY